MVNLRKDADSARSGAALPAGEPKRRLEPGSMNCDVLVVGAGPAGSTAALTCAALGLRTVLLEEHPEVGHPVHCTGKLSAHAFKRFGLPSSLAQNALRGAALHAPDGSVARVRRASVDSYLVDRAELDRYLAEQASSSGAEVLVGARARTVVRNGGRGIRAGGAADGGLRVEVEQGRTRFAITTPLVIDAEGAAPVLPPQLGLAPRRAFVHGLQYDLEGAAIEQEDAPDLYFGWSVAPGFFGWFMPTGGGRGRLGVAVDPQWATRPPIHYLEALRTAHPAASPRLRNARILRRLAGRIPILGQRRPTYTDGMLVIGDAAGQVKATSGGGIYFAMQAGEIAGRAAARYLGSAADGHGARGRDAGAAFDRGARGALEGYEREWRAAFGREVLFTTIARQALNRLSDRHISTIIRALAGDSGLRRAVEEHGDTQYQSRLMRPLLVSAVWAGLRDLRLAPTVLAALGAAMLSVWSDGGAPSPARTWSVS
ncbi:MAG: NAD(P)/FAD-dependent oxidoreductase [bacterium]|nr:NAD(P)/FAD-dependent oxidoreductase [bacterium]